MNQQLKRGVAGKRGSASSRSAKAPHLGAALRMTQQQHDQLQAHLFPGDGKEAVALAVCGRAGTAASPYNTSRPRQVLTIHRIVPVAYADCDRGPAHVTWRTDALVSVLQMAASRNMAVLKIHSHPEHFPRFSPTDDHSDREIFAAISNYIDGSLPHASAIMLPDGSMFARLVSSVGAFETIESVSVVGADWRIWYASDICVNASADARNSLSKADVERHAFSERTRQAFGSGTVDILSRLSIAVIGASGTGSPVVEMLARLGVGELVLVDPDVIEDKNRNRILHSTARDARRKTKKVEVLARAVRQMGLGTRVLPIDGSLWDEGVVARVAQCDAAIGGMDSVDGRDLLNRLASYYSIPYIDIGVHLDADGNGGVSQISGSVHYIFPGGSSLVSRGVFTPDEVRAAVLRRTEPDSYREQVEAKYIKGADEDRPAVISVNMLFASLGVNELLARLHGFRDDPNFEYGRTQMSLTQWRMATEAEAAPCGNLGRKVGRGDLVPLLDTPSLSGPGTANV